MLWHPILVSLCLALAAQLHTALALIDFPSSSSSTPQRTFVSQLLDDTKLRYVKNSGVCEITHDVQQISGYIDIGTNMSMWFWFFEARHSPSTAPFTLWLNGGPGCSSLIGLFQENGPCNVNEAGTDTTLNPYSWNELSNMIYIDQPIGAGFSYGDVIVNSTYNAAPYVWTAFQILFESDLFHKYAGRKFILATESYGGHYGPEFVTYFNKQNAAIDNGTIKGEKIKTSVLMINNGWYDPLIQNEAYVTFAANPPGYEPWINTTVLKQINESYYKQGGCEEQIKACYAAKEPQSNKICEDADLYCLNNVLTPSLGDRDEYDLRHPAGYPFPSKSYLKFLGNDTMKKKIGAVGTYSECSDESLGMFNKTGDDARSLLPELSALVDSNLKTLIWAGDADINCNWVGGHASVLAMDWYGKNQLQNLSFTNLSINGTLVGEYQNLYNFSFARIFQSGHEVPAYKPEASLEIFRQMINLQPLHSVP